MFKKAAAALLAALILGGATSALAGPFGINMGDPISKYQVAKSLGNGQYRLAAVPNPRSDVDFVTVIATPSQGVCKVAAAGKTFENDAYGSDVKSAFMELKAALAAKYGPSKDFDFLRYGSIWDEPRDYAMALYKEERTLASFWTKDEGSSLSDHLSSIGLTAEGLGPSATYWHLSYEFDNFDACFDEIKGKDNGAL